MKLLIISFLLVFCLLKLHAQNSITSSLKQKLSVAAEDTNRVSILGKLSGEYMWFLADSAKKYAQEGLVLTKKLNYKPGEAVCSYNLSVSLLQQGDFINSLYYGFNALSIFEKAKDSQNIVNCHGVLMICYREQGDYKQALVHGYIAKNALPVSSPESIHILGNISSVFEKNNQLDSALFYGLKTYTLDKNYAPQLITLGNIYYKLKDPTQSLRYFRKSVLNTSGWDLMDTYLGMSKVFNLNNIFDSSVYYAHKSLLISESIGHPRGKLDASKQLAQLYDLKGINDSTVKYLKLINALSNSFFSLQKTREVQIFAFNEKMHKQELVAKEIQNKNKVRLYALLGVAIFFLIIAWIEYRNNKQKIKANTLLTQQKEKVETTLAELKAVQSQLIQSEKMASLGELTAGIAHEIQNPLNFVNNFSEVNTELIEEADGELIREIF